MSSLSDLSHLRSEKEKVEALLAEAISAMDVVAEMNFQSRLDTVLKQISELERTDAKAAEVALLFDGKPVRGQKSIDARFASKALGYFQDIVSKLYAASSPTGLKGSRGLVPKATQSALRITDIAYGSFGFVLEENDNEQYNVVPTSAREALDTAVHAINELTQRDDDQFLVEVEKINPRLFSSLTTFFTHLHKNEASLKTNLPTGSFSHSSSDIERAYQRLTQTNISLEKLIWTGRLVGLSPSNRTFDFLPDDTVEIRSGKFDQQISQDYLEKIENDGVLLGARFRAEIEQATLKKPNGTTTISYTALGFEEAVE